MSEHPPPGPFGGDRALYQQIAAWAPAIAGYVHFDLTPETPGLVGKPGITIAELDAGSALLLDLLFIAEPFDGTTPTLFVDTDLHPDLQTHSLDSIVDWQGDGTISEGRPLLGDPHAKLWLEPDAIRVRLDDELSGGDPGSTTGLAVVVLRILPRVGDIPRVGA